jgi:hypothetical protein
MTDILPLIFLFFFGVGSGVFCNIFQHFGKQEKDNYA